MGKRHLLSLAVTFLFCFPGFGLCEGADADRPNGADPPARVDARGTCATIAAILTVYPPLEVRRSDGPVRDSRTFAEHPGCRVLVSGPTALIAGEVDPADAVRVFFAGTGWEEDIRLAADGPGTTSFVFRKNGIFCQLRGGANSWIEDGKTFTSETYELEAGCVPPSN
ncbi:MAG: hypothetical protein H6Q80_700 [Deltaproteobacteria bacterium]|nr:hypothetical protein [Deltaproteobacteria bacterium]